MEKICPVCNQAVSPLDAVCPSCGFKLHGSTEAMDPLKLDASGAAVASNTGRIRPASLTVLKGPQVGVRIDLSESLGTMMVGRSPRCEVFLNDMTVSREHASIESTDAGWQITDQNSYNGTWINNTNITSTILKNGDIIQIGAFCLRFNS